MKVDLLNPSERRIIENAGDRIPHGLVSIASKLQSNGHDVRLYDFNHTSARAYLEQFRQRRPDAVGVSVYTSPVVPEAKQIANMLKGQTHLIAGGYHASALPYSLPEFDSIVAGEAEELIEHALTNSGVVFGDDVDLSKLPQPDLDLLDINKYQMQQSGERTATLITSRGCPYECSFCGKMSRKVRTEPIDKVRQQMEDFKEKGFESLYFLDDVFTLDKDRLWEITGDARELGMPFRVTTRANLINDEKLDMLAFNGCNWLSMGIESGNNEILAKSNKGMTTEQNLEAVIKANNRQINTKGFFILGLPGETEETAKQTIEFSQRLKEEGLTSADFYFLTPFPGTPIWARPNDFGIEITNQDYTKYLEAGKGARCYVNTEELKAERIEELVIKAKEEWNG